MDYSEKVSIGGESIASSEYESVSLIEETGLCGCEGCIVCGCVRGVGVCKHVCVGGCVHGGCL